MSGASAEVSGPNFHAKVNKKQRARQITPAAVRKTACPECDFQGASKFVVKRHLKLKHKLSQEAIDKFSIAMTTKRCEHCRGEFKNLWVHECKRAPVKDVPTKAANVLQPSGKRFHPGFATFLSSQVEANTAHQYDDKARVIGQFWKDMVDFFRVDGLMEPLHHNVIFPSLTSYHNQSQSIGDSNVAIKAYKYLIDYSIKLFNIRYSADPNFTMSQKKDWKRDTKDNKDEYDRKQKKLIQNAKHQSTENASEVQEKGVLEFNLPRLAQVAHHFLGHKLVIERLTALAEDTPELIKSKYPETDLRYCLMGQLCASTGKRSDAKVNMKIGALLSAKQT